MHQRFIRCQGWPSLHLVEYWNNVINAPILLEIEWKLSSFGSAFSGRRFIVFSVACWNHDAVFSLFFV